MHADYEVSLPTTSTQGERGIVQASEKAMAEGSGKGIEREQEIAQAQEQILYQKQVQARELERKREINESQAQEQGQARERIEKQVMGKRLSVPILVLLALLLLVGGTRCSTRPYGRGTLNGGVGILH